MLRGPRRAAVVDASVRPVRDRGMPGRGATIIALRARARGTDWRYARVVAIADNRWCLAARGGYGAPPYLRSVPAATIKRCSSARRQRRGGAVVSFRKWRRLCAVPEKPGSSARERSCRRGTGRPADCGIFIELAQDTPGGGNRSAKRVDRSVPLRRASQSFGEARCACQRPAISPGVLTRWSNSGAVCMPGIRLAP